MPRKMMAISGGPDIQSQIVWLDRPDFGRGDAQFFDPTSTERFQIRPLCLSDMATGYTYRPGCWHLVVLTKSGAKLRATVSLPDYLQKNTPANAKVAYRRLIRQQPDFEKLVQVCDRALEASA